MQRLSRHVITWNCCSEAKQLEYSLTIKYMQGKDICTYYQSSTWFGQRDIRSYLQRKMQEKFIMEETKWRRYQPSIAVVRTAVQIRYCCFCIFKRLCHLVIFCGSCFFKNMLFWYYFMVCLHVCDTVPKDNVRYRIHWLSKNTRLACGCQWWLLLHRWPLVHC